MRDAQCGWEEHPVLQRSSRGQAAARVELAVPADASEFRISAMRAESHGRRAVTFQAKPHLAGTLGGDVAATYRFEHPELPRQSDDGGHL